MNNLKLVERTTTSDIKLNYDTNKKSITTTLEWEQWWINCQKKNRENSFNDNEKNEKNLFDENLYDEIIVKNENVLNLIFVEN